MEEGSRAPLTLPREAWAQTLGGPMKSSWLCGPRSTADRRASSSFPICTAHLHKRARAHTHARTHTHPRTKSANASGTCGSRGGTFEKVGGLRASTIARAFRVHARESAPLRQRSAVLGWVHRCGCQSHLAHAVSQRSFRLRGRWRSDCRRLWYCNLVGQDASGQHESREQAE